LGHHWNHSDGYPIEHNRWIVKRGLEETILVLIAGVSGCIVLSGYFFDIRLLNSVRLTLLNYAAILVGVVMIIGGVNIIRVHRNKILAGSPSSAHSLVLLTSFFATIAIVAFFGITSNYSAWIYENVLIPVERSLLALLAVVLLTLGVHIRHNNLNLFRMVFILTVILSLLSATEIPGIEKLRLDQVYQWLAGVLSIGGARGIILGVALGTLAAGLRLLMGIDRPYSD